MSAIKSHLYRLLKPILDIGEDEEWRIKIAKAPVGLGKGVSELRDVVRGLEGTIQVGLSRGSFGI